VVSQREEEILRNARSLREKEHRLRPSLRLKTLSEAQAFTQTRGIVSVFGGNELPSIVSAFLGREWKPSGKGFTSWLEWWSIKIQGKSLGRTIPQLEQAGDIVSTRIFRKSKTLVSRPLWSILDPIVKHYRDQASERETFSKTDWNILEFIGEHGPIRTDRLRTELNLEDKSKTASFHSSLSKLESFALIVGSEDPKPERHLHANIWSSWKTRTRQGAGAGRLSYRDATEQLLMKTIDSAIIAPEKDVGKWFQWKQSCLEAKTRLLDSGRILQADNLLVTARANRTLAH